MSSFKFKRNILVLIVFSLTVFSVQIPKTAQAQVPGFTVYDPINAGANTTMIGILNSMVGGTGPAAQATVKPIMLITKRILRQMTQDIVTWIEGNFKNPDGTKSPAFITNTEQFFLETADIAIGDLLLGSELDFLCDPFKINLKLSLGLQYQPFAETIKCTLSGAIGNATSSIQDYSDFIASGGWDTWLQYTTVPQNNQMGAMILVQAELDQRVADKKIFTDKELSWGGGFMSWKECPTEDAASMETVDLENEDNRLNRFASMTGQKRDTKGCVIKTPGSEIMSWGNWSNTSVIRELELADSLDAIFNSLADLTIRKTLEKASGSLIRSPDTQYQKNIAELARLEAEASLSTGGSASGNNPTYNGTGGSANFNATSVANKNIALTTIDSQIAIETNFLTAQANMYEMLEATKNVFNSSTCSTTIKDSVINQITGNYTGFKEIPWNMEDVTTVSAITTENISTLNTTRSNVAATTNDANVPNLVQNLTSLNTLHTTESVASVSEGGTAFNSLKNWIASKIALYSSQCTIDKAPLAEWGI